MLNSNNQMIKMIKNCLKNQNFENFLIKIMIIFNKIKKFKNKLLKNEKCLKSKF